MDFPRIVVGYHGCLDPVGSQLLSGERPVKDWPQSRNAWDWLGRGIYFWEHSPERALRWAEQKARRRGGTPMVIGALLQLGKCLDLTDTRDTQLLLLAHRQVSAAYAAAGRDLPRNAGSTPDLKRRTLDCLVINYFVSESSVPYQTVRGVFLEGDPVYPGAMIRRESHVQIAARDLSCILGVFRPNLA